MNGTAKWMKYAKDANLHQYLFPGVKVVCRASGAAHKNTSVVYKNVYHADLDTASSTVFLHVPLKETSHLIAFEEVSFIILAALSALCYRIEKNTAPASLNLTKLRLCRLSPQ